LPGPHIDVTGPYLEGKDSHFIQMPHLTGPEDARQLVEYWAERRHVFQGLHQHYPCRIEGRD
jgi:hypothetical protein